MGTLEEENAKLELQRQYFASDDHIRSEVEPWITATVAERMEVGEELCKMAAAMFARLDPEVQRRALYRPPLPDDTIALLARLR